MNVRDFSEDISSSRSTEVVADYRERHSGVIEALQGVEGLTVTEDRLQIGDYLVEQKVLIERKTLLDLGTSIQQIPKKYDNGTTYGLRLVVKSCMQHPSNPAI